MQFIFSQLLKKIKKENIWKILIFLPILIYLGKRSLIAYDEGIYALQAKWILNNGNWIAPTWWGEISLDRTIGIQALIAFSQKLFGQSYFSIYIPNIIASSFMLFFTYSLHKEFFVKYPISSPLILSTTFLWINYSHLATQDLIYSSIITLGIYSSVKYIKNKKNIFLFLTGIWIGWAFMMKTYLTVIPLLAVIPFFIYCKIFSRKLFWIGLIIGFVPFTIWSLKIIIDYDYATYSGLFEKLLSLSEKNIFTNPIYYYLWNIPINIFPWTVLALFGSIKSLKNRNFVEKYILFFYPLFNILLLSIFSTKTPYYPLQILSLISLNAYKGIAIVFNKKAYIVKVISYLNFYLIPTTLLILTLYINSDFSKLVINNDDKFLISTTVLVFSIGWLLVGFVKSKKNKILLTLLGPYLMTCIFVQSGTLSDRSKDFRIAAQNLIRAESLEEKKVEVVKSDINSRDAHSKIIKISLLMPKIGNGLKDINDLGINEYAWITNSNLKIKKEHKIRVVYDSEVFSPWKLILREN